MDQGQHVKMHCQGFRVVEPPSLVHAEGTSYVLAVELTYEQMHTLCVVLQKRLWAIHTEESRA